MAQVLTFETAALDELYHTKPARGRVAPVEEMLIIDPPWPCWTSLGIKNCDARKMLLTLTSKTRWNSSTVTDSEGCGFCTGGEIGSVLRFQPYATAQHFLFLVGGN